MLGAFAVFLHGHGAEHLRKLCGELHFVTCVRNARNTVIFLGKLRPVCGNQLCGQYLLPRPDCLRVLHCHNVVFLVYKVRCDRKHKKLAFLQRRRYIFVEILTGSKKFVIPYGDIAAKLVFVYEPHKLLRVFSVLLTVTQKNVCAEGRTHALRRFVADEHGFQIFLQLFRVAYRGYVAVVFIEKLQVAALFIEKLLQPLLLHQRQDGDMMLHCIAELHVKCAVAAAQELFRNGHNEKLHLREVAKKVFVIFGIRLFVVPYGTVYYFQNFRGNGFQKDIPILRVSTEPYARFFLQARCSVCDTFQLCHTDSLSQQFFTNKFYYNYIISQYIFQALYTRCSGKQHLNF